MADIAPTDTATATSGFATDVCSGPSTTISTSSEASAIADCPTYDGDVIIDDLTTGSISLNGVQQITGDLICNNATQLTSLASDQLSTIGGSFSLTGTTILSSLRFDSLNSINRINWVGLPALQSLNFPQGVSRANQVYISNTQLNNLKGLELTAVGTIDVNNNPYLESVEIVNLVNITSSLSFSANGRSLEVRLPSLEAAGNLTFRNVSEVYIPSLETVTGSLGFYSSSFTSFKAPNLTSTGGSLAFVDNPNLNELSLLSLTTIGGGFLLINNTDLASVNGLPELQTIGGAITWAGSFDSVTLPSLSDVRGGSNVQTTSNNETICELFDTAHDRGIIKGVNTCIIAKANSGSDSSATGGGGNDAGFTSSSGSGSSLSGGAIGGIVAGVVVGMIALGVAIWFWRRQRKSKRVTGPRGTTTSIPYEKPELPGSTAYQKQAVTSSDQTRQQLSQAELSGDHTTSRAELSANETESPNLGPEGRAELPGHHPFR